MPKQQGKRPRRTFTAEFKSEAVRLVRDEGLSVARVAEDLGIAAVQAGVSRNLRRRATRDRPEIDPRFYPVVPPEFCFSDVTNVTEAELCWEDTDCRPDDMCVLAADIDSHGVRDGTGRCRPRELPRVQRLTGSHPEWAVRGSCDERSATGETDCALTWWDDSAGREVCHWVQPYGGLFFEDDPPIDTNDFEVMVFPSYPWDICGTRACLCEGIVEDELSMLADYYPWGPPDYED